MNSRLMPANQLAAIVTLLTVGQLSPQQAAAVPIVNVELRPELSTIDIGQLARIGIWLATNNGANHVVSAVDIMFGWNPDLLHFTGIDNAGGSSLLFSGLPPISPNEAIPPADGDGYYNALALFGLPITATPAGTLLTTLQFTAVTATIGTDVLVLPTAGSPSIPTVVWDGTIPNYNVTGWLGSAHVVVVPEPSSAAILGWGCLWILRRRSRKSGRS